MERPLKENIAITTYKDLKIWQRSMELVQRVYKLTNQFPERELWGLIPQMRRAAVSVPSNIAEGYGRHATGDYRRHLCMARGSLLELETQMILCRKLGIGDGKDVERGIADIEPICKMLSSLILKLG